MTQQSQQDQPTIVTDWVNGTDDSTHRLEAAITSQQASGGMDAGPLFALHNTANPKHVLTCTGKELREFAQDVQQGSIGKMLATAGKGRPGQ